MMTESSGEARRERARRRWSRKTVPAALLLVIPLLLAADVLPRRPSGERKWVVEQSRVPRVRMLSDTVHITDVRDFRHHADRASDEHWIDGRYAVADVERVWFALSPFSARFRALAHPFLSFQFADGRFLAVSVEARKEVGENYSAVLGLLRRFETMMVIGTEEDLLGLRAVAWDDPLYLFPVRISEEQARALFVLLMERAQGLERTPEFYNTATNNCTTNLIAPINALAADERRVGWRIGLMPGYAYETAYDRGWIDTDLAREDARSVYRVNDRVRGAMGRPDFSAAIRR
jgi:hypothetical protein